MVIFLNTIGIFTRLEKEEKTDEIQMLVNHTSILKYEYLLVVIVSDSNPSLSIVIEYQIYSTIIFDIR